MNSLEELPALECWKLLATADVGRLAYLMEDRVEIVPVNYLVQGESIVFASTQGSKLRSIHTSPSVAFEVDDIDVEINWSIVLHGTALRMNSGLEIEASGIRALRHLSPLDKWNYIRIEPTAVTGRRFTRRPVPLASVPTPTA
jgi:nitroimidazol reductase NimA-like FMN-containing flavoprotein (pyridoxamine 5'-phosphate oxidase superfamily)